MNKYNIIENSSTRNLNILKQNEYIESFKRAKLDTEINELTEEGLDDFINIKFTIKNKINSKVQLWN